MKDYSQNNQTGYCKQSVMGDKRCCKAQMRIYQYRRQYYILIGKAEEEGGPFRRGRRRREHKDLYSDHLDQYIKQLNPEVLIVYRKRIGGISVNYMWVMDNGIHNSN